jgi:ankyrin repeat protein
MVRFFVNNDAKINAKDNNDYTPLLYTCTCNSNPSVIVEELILHGANVKQKTKDGKTVFHLILKNPKYNNELREILVKAFQVRHELEKSGFNFDELESSCSCNENKP